MYVGKVLIYVSDDKQMQRTAWGYAMHTEFYPQRKMCVLSSSTLTLHPTTTHNHHMARPVARHGPMYQKRMATPAGGVSGVT